MFDKAKIVSFFSIISYYLFCISIIAGINNTATLFACIFILPYALHIVNLKKENTFFVILLFFLVVGSLMNFMISRNGIGGTLVIVGVLFMSRFVIENVRIIRPHVLLFLIVFITITAYKMFVLGMDPNDIYTDMSRNYIGLTLVMLNSLYSFLLYVDKKQPPLLISGVSMIMAFFLLGRSSIIAMFIILLLNFFMFFKEKKAAMIFLLATCTIAVSYFTYELQSLYNMSLFKTFGMDTPRYQMWKDFFEQVSFYTFIIGMDTFSIHSIAIFNGNVHNDFLSLLARTGIGFVAFVPIFLYSLIVYIRKHEIYPLVIIFIISFRIFYDTGVFVSNLGFCFYSVLLYPFLYNKNQNNEYSGFNVHDEQKGYLRFES